MPTYISLLRGINVGGNKIIKMADLKALYESLALMQVQTLLQSGNVVFQSVEEDSQKLRQLLEMSIFGQFGFESKIILRDAATWQTIVSACPLSGEQLAEPAKVQVVFFAETPLLELVQSFMASYEGVEVMNYQGQELYISYPEGIGRSKLTHALIEKQTKSIGTARNWNTVTKLLKLAEKSA